MTYRSTDEELERSTNKWMVWGLVLMVIMVLVFPIYRWYEPAGRAEALEQQQADLAKQGQQLFGLNCSGCHGVEGEGGVGPALNSQQFLSTTADEQINALIATGIPGTAMASYSLVFGGPLTSEQINALTAYIRSWEPDAPDVPGWRDCCDEGA